jgi:SRSO17 transposase
LKKSFDHHQDNCQVAVTLSLANHDASLPIAYRLYLPEDWAKDQARRHKAKIPETMAFHTKPEIALEQIKAARSAALPQGVVLMDAGYGNDTSLRTEITALDMSYVAGIGPNTSVWPPGVAPLLPQTRSARGRPQTRLQRDEAHQPVTVKALALSLPEEVGGVLPGIERQPRKKLEPRGRAGRGCLIEL